MPAMKVDLGIWAWLNRAVVALLVAAAIVGLGAWYVPKIQDNEALRLSIYEKEQELAQELQMSNQLRAEILSSQDREQVERWVREQWNWGRSNELIIRFVDPPEQNNGRPAR